MKKEKSIILPSVIPVRFPADEELAAAMRALPVMRLARALARWVGDEPIPIADGWQAPETKLDAARALGLVAEDGTLTDEITRRVNWIYEIAFHAGYLHTEHGAVHRHHGLDTATEQTDAQIRTAWDGALNALFAHGIEDVLPEAANPAPLDFHGIGNFPLLAMLEQHGTATVAELSGEIALGATEGMTPSAAEHAWAAWTSKHDDPTRGYLRLAEGLGLLRIDGETATLTPLGTWAMLRQLHNAHLEHLPDSAELTPYQVLVCRLGMSDEAFARELECWLTAREPVPAPSRLPGACRHRPAPPGQKDRESRPCRPPQGILSPVTDGAPLQPGARSGRAPPAREKRSSPGPPGAWPASRQLGAAAARPRTSGQPAPCVCLPSGLPGAARRATPFGN